MVTTYDMTQVFDGVFQGPSTNDVLPAGIEAVMDLMQSHEDHFPPPAVFCWMPIPDGPPFPGIGWLQVATGFVLNCQASQRPVLVHCRAGISRSGMVTVASLMVLKRWSRDTALASIRQQRPQTNPNPTFMDGLLAWQAYLQIPT